MSCSKCKKKVIEKLPEPTVVVEDKKMLDIERLNFIFKARNPAAYLDEIKFLWKEIFEKELEFDLIIAKRVFDNYYKNLEK